MSIEYLVKVDFQVDSGNYQEPNWNIKTEYTESGGRIAIPVINDEETKRQLGERPDVLVVNIFKDVERIDLSNELGYVIRMEFFSIKKDEKKGINENLSVQEVFTFPKHVVKIPEVPENRKAEGFDRVNEVQIMIYKRV